MRQSFQLMFILLVVLGFTLPACSGGSTQQLSQEQKADAPAAPPGHTAAGQEIYNSSCTACHGADAKGVKGLGKNLTTSNFVAQQSDQELVEFLKVGRGTDDPLNDTGIAMPPKGGNPALTDDDLLNLVAFLRTIQR